MAECPISSRPRAKPGSPTSSPSSTSTVYPNEAEYEEQAHEVRPRRRPAAAGQAEGGRPGAGGLWNLFLPHLAPDSPGTKLSNLDYAPISEQLGKVTFASEVLNLLGADTGNMEILNAYGSENVKRDWLAPLLEGEIRSAFSMTEPDVASSDATNIGLRITRDGNDYVLNGTKWFSSGALTEPRCPRPHRDGEDRSRRPATSSAVDDRRAQGHAGRQDRPHTARLRLRPRRRASGDLLRRDRAGLGRQPARRGGRRVRHVASPPWPGSHPPLHALDRRRRAGARADDRAGPAALDVRLDGRPEGPDPGLDRRVAHRDRHVPGVRAAHRTPDGHRREQGGGD